MSDITLSYKNTTIATIDASGTKTLNTQGKYCEDNITLQYVKPSGGDVQLTSLTVHSNKYTTYLLNEAFDTSGTVLYAHYSNGAMKTLTSGFTFSPATFSATDTQVTFSYTELGITVTATTPITVITSQTGFDTTLDNNSWGAVHAAGERSVGANYWAVGDRHNVVLNGTMYSDSSTTVTLDTTYYAFILGFDHNSAVEGIGISFGCFKTYANDAWRDICISSSQMNSSNTNSGGWNQSRMRYYTLGSTDTINGNASSTTATNPVANTLMSCFPLELRTYMQPITKYTNNLGNDTTESAVWSTIDYLPLLAEWEIFGAISYANQYEQNYQARYAYYTAGNSRVKWGHTSLAASDWWERSPRASNNNLFCFVGTSGSAGYYGLAPYLYGVTPAFLV